MSQVETQGGSRVLGVVVCDFEHAAIGTRSRLDDSLGGKRLIEHVVERLAAVSGVNEVALLVPAEQMAHAAGLQSPNTPARVHVLPLEPRSGSVVARVRTGRAWNLCAWRGGAGQWTAFDEEYHPAGIARACAKLQADHVLAVHSHGAFLDVALAGALVDHHLHKNHEMRVTYTPAAPGLCGMVLRADIVAEMGAKGVMPAHLLAYDPKAPAFDTLIREACMQVDPALSKIPNRFCLDTERSWGIAEALLQSGPFETAAEMALAAARGVAPGVRDVSRVHDWPREVELELTTHRLTAPPGAVPQELRAARAQRDAASWVRWLSGQKMCDDLLITVGGDGDPLLYPGLMDVLRAWRASGPLSIGLQTDLAGGDVDALLAAAAEGLVDVIGVTMYGHTAATYAQVAGADLHGIVMRNMERLAEVTRTCGGVPLVVPRLLKVRQTIPELEAFFDAWLERCGWAVIDGPTDRAGAVPFAAVVDMAPPKRRPCRRLWDRMLIRADGAAAACDQDVHGRLAVGNAESLTIQEMWRRLQSLRDLHAAGRWNEIDPCRSCREWHRP